MDARRNRNPGEDEKEPMAASTGKMSPFSVVIPAFNSAATLAATLDSVSAQTEPPAEVIVVDDGSTDQTAQIATEHGAQVIRQENAGPAAARANGSRAAVSEYIAYIDGDDWWLPDWLATARQVIETEAVHMLFTDLRRSEPGRPESEWLSSNSTSFPWLGEFLTTRGVKTGIPELYRLESPDAMALLLKGFPVFPSTVVMRKASLLACGNWAAEFRRAEDFATSLRIAPNFPLHYFARVSAILGLHEVNRDWRKYVKLQSNWDIQVLRSHAERTKDPRFVAALAHRYCSLAWLYRTEGAMKEARHLYAQAMRYGNRAHAFSRWCLTWLSRRSL
jgi:glycosyltransferase involved in cell wall biosynthesis